MHLNIRIPKFLIQLILHHFHGW